MKNRSGFVSNSSSSSFIVFHSNVNDTLVNGLKNKYKGEELIVDANLGYSQFGWEFATHCEFGSKLIFCYLQVKYSPDSDQVRLLDMLERSLKRNLEVKNVEWKINLDSSNDPNWGYIDHQSAAHEGKNIEMFEDDDKLDCFLFSENSYIQTGNDNEDGYYYD